MSWRALTSALLAALLAPACGAGGDEPVPAAPPPAVDLRVEFWPRGPGGAETTATLTCEPTGGTHPRPAAACAALAAHPEALDPVPGEALCTQIHGGSETAAVSGTVSGERVEARFGRENGCEIARWDALDALLRLSR
ncbi:MAG TPA: SSI family serine proteinase inhibitor [Gaiellaceae bacterium]|nr:SSI family serine proteinase inhibitor [Gaiellaceae bacterium]